MNQFSWRNSQGLTLIAVLFLFCSCTLQREIESTASKINRYEVVALHLAKDKRDLQLEIQNLNYRLKELEAKNQFLEIQLKKKKGVAKRSLASVAQKPLFQEDLVKQSTYNWNMTQLLKIAEKEFERKNYKKSAQFFSHYIQLEPQHKTLDDKILFQAGLAAYESKKYYGLSEKFLSKLIKDYPTSSLYRGAKLWKALAQFHLGNKKSFYLTVEEFRKKYKNTPEWGILRGHYEEINQRYKI